VQVGNTLAFEGGVMADKLEALRLLIQAMTRQAQMETDETRKAMITENVRKLSKRYTEERIKGGKVTQQELDN
jgi:uncharacterized protein YtpQ (UPF0354 family)